MACEAESLTIGTKKAFDNDYAFPYEKRQIAGETIYICNRGSDWSRRNEVLLLRCEEGTWIAYDGAISADLKKKSVPSTSFPLPCDGRYTERMASVANQLRCQFR